MSTRRCHKRLGARTAMGTSTRNRSTRTTIRHGTPPAPPVDTFFLLMETGDKLLIETGDKILLEESP